MLVRNEREEERHAPFWLVEVRRCAFASVLSLCYDENGMNYPPWQE